MILITGGSAYNASKFLKNTKYNFLIPVHRSTPEVRNKNVFIFKDFNKLINSEEFKHINFFVNFASSYNKNISYIELFRSSILFALKFLFKLDKKSLVLFINIGSYSQDSNNVNKTKKKYVNIKNFSDRIFCLIVGKEKFINLKIGDTYGENDPRNKLNSVLNNHKNKSTLILSGNKENILYPVSIDEINNCLDYIISNYKLFNKMQITQVRAFGTKISLEEYIDKFKKSNNFEFDIVFESNDYNKECVKTGKSDFCFIINNF